MKKTDKTRHESLLKRLFPAKPACCCVELEDLDELKEGKADPRNPADSTGCCPPSAKSADPTASAGEASGS